MLHGFLQNAEGPKPRFCGTNPCLGWWGRWWDTTCNLMKSYINRSWRFSDFTKEFSLPLLNNVATSSELTKALSCPQGLAFVSMKPFLGPPSSWGIFFVFDSHSIMDSVTHSDTPFYTVSFYSSQKLHPTVIMQNTHEGKENSVKENSYHIVHVTFQPSSQSLLPLSWI